MNAITKAEKTTQFIIETVAPVFNSKGYIGTSMSDITEATGLTKGAIYGNFENKNALALEAFNYNIRKLVWKIADQMNAKDTAPEKLQAMTDFYRTYYDVSMLQGGCPLLNIGIDSHNTHSDLHMRVVDVITKIIQNIADIINQGKEEGSIKMEIDSEEIADRFYSIIQGSIFTSLMFKSGIHLANMMDHLDEVIRKDILK
jgi:AcrR family transcriptional regulator